jgi:hypothetical protein
MVTDEGQCVHCLQYHPPHPGYPHQCPLGFSRPRRVPQPTIEEESAQQERELRAKHDAENRVKAKEEARRDVARAKARSEVRGTVEQFRQRRSATIWQGSAEVHTELATARAQHVQQVKAGRLEQRLEASAHAREHYEREQVTALIEASNALERRMKERRES